MRASTGCTTCIKRKVKCDEVRPFCRRCIKAKRTCLGYRLPNKPGAENAFFTSSTALPAPATSPDCKAIILDDRVSPTTSLWSQSPLEPQTLEVRALCCFFEDFVWVPKRFDFFLDHLPRVYRQSAPNSGLATVARAVSLAYLANKTQDHSLEILARKQYGSALASVNRCLGAVTSPIDDQMMLSLLLLILFENLAVTEAAPNKFLNAWIAHLSGSSMAASQRGMAQLETGVGKAMFRIQILKMVTYAMLKGEPLPKFAEAWTRKMATHEEDAGVDLLSAVRQTSIMFQRTKTLLQSIASTESAWGQGFLHMQHLDELSDHVEAMFKLDGEYDTLLASMKGDALPVSEERAWVGSNTGTFLACRLIHNRILGICASKLALAGPASPAAPMEALRAQELRDHANYVQSNVLRSIIRFVTDATGLTTRYPEPPVSSGASPLSGFLNLFPVFVALHGTPENTAEQRTWFTSVLHHFARNDGLSIATTFASEPYSALDNLAEIAGV